MKPSSSSTLASATFRFVAAISTNGRSISFALRMRVSMSAIGSVIIARVPNWEAGPMELPGRFADAGNQAVGGHFAEADAADAELAVDGAAAAAQLAAVADADLELAGHQ